MAEMNLKQITDKLNSEFAADERTLVFWYDANAEFSEDVDSLMLKNAKILHLFADQQFYTKYFLECIDPKNNYLVYAPFAKPDIRENHLEDIIRYSKEFFADRISLLVLDLGIDERYKSVIERHIKFFANKERTQKFYELEIEVYNEDTIEVALMSVLCKLKTTSFEEILRCVLTEDGFKDNKYLAEFEKYDLINAFWRQVDIAFGYSEPNKTLERLAITMFVTYASKTIHSKVVSTWKEFISYKFGNIIAFLDHLMNSFLYANRFDEISKEVWQGLEMESTLREVEPETLIDCNIFQGIDRILIDWMVARLENEDTSAKLSGKTIPEVCLDRRKKHFGNDFQREYLMIEHAYNIILAGRYEFISGIRNIVKAYTDSIFRIDRSYRYFYLAFDRLEETLKYEKLRELVENIYTNDYLNQITVNWNTEIAEANGETGLVLQRDFYSKYIEHVKERTVVIISDAFRYEVADTLFMELHSDEKCSVALSALQGVVPSYTPLGMAALLPHQTIEFNDRYDVLVDGRICTLTKQREAQLRQYKPNSRCIQFDAIKSMKQKELREIFTGQEVVYIYHNQIDARGDSAKTENEVFTACNEVLREIHEMMRRLASQANTHHFFITTDHGFIYKRDRLESCNKISSNLNTGLLGQRFALSNQELTVDGVCSTRVGKILGNTDERYISYPLASDIFKVAGAGQNFVHGGSSPQEMIIPLLKVKVERGKKETKTAEIALVSLTNKVSNLMIALDFVQTEPVSDIVKEARYRVFFVSEGNERISNENIVIADKKDTDTVRRMFRLRFSFKNRQYNQFQKYYLVACDDNNGVEILRHEVIIDITCTDNFDSFK